MSLLILLGCGPLVVAWPPPSALPTQVAPLDAREVEVGLGVTPAFGQLQGRNLFQGTIVGEAGVGLGRDLSLTLSGTRNWLGPAGAAELAWWPKRADRVDAGALFSLGGAWSEGTWTDQGDPDAKGDEVDLAYHYVSVAPGLGGQAAWHAGEYLSFPTRARVSYSRTIPNETLSSSRWAVWTELGAGARVQATERLAFGAGVQLLWIAPNGAFVATPFPSVAVSAQGRFGGD